MNVLEKNFALGFGTSRLPITSINDMEGVEKSAELIVKAIEMGVNYIDASYTYSHGKALNAINIALKNTSKNVSVTVKSSYEFDKTPDDVKQRIFLQLKELGLSRTDYFVSWNITSYEMFQKIKQKGGVYDSLLKLKQEKIIDHICCSLHMPPEEIARVIEGGIYEGITISYSLLNASSMQIVLDAAIKHGVGVVVMNSLGGGLIPQNPDLFSYAAHENENVIEAALRFAKAHPAVNIVLSGINNDMELEENIKVFATQNRESNSIRLHRVLSLEKELKGICTGCGYCTGCPKDIPISTIMSARNNLLFKNSTAYNRADSELCKNINLFCRCEYMPEIAENICVKCGICERKCTQKLEIIDGVADFYERAKNCGYSLFARTERIKSIFENVKYKKTGLFPNGGFANYVIEAYNSVYKNGDMKWVLFNNNTSLHGKTDNGITIHSPNDIVEIAPDIIIVCSYKYEEEIFQQLLKYEKLGIKIIKLHSEHDIPWVW